MHTLFAAAAAVLVLNVPFGFWRSGVPKFSASWFAAVHLPVLPVAGIRILSGLGWSLSTTPALVGAYFAGQCIGGLLRRRRKIA